jgi:hypothetical protein
MQRADLLITLGARFDDRVTGKLDGFAPEAKIIHADIDPAELGKVRNPDVPIVGDCRLIIEDLIVAIKRLMDRGEVAPDRGAVEELDQRLAGALPLRLRAGRGRRRPQAPDGARAPAGTRPPTTPSSCRASGQHQMWTSQYWKFNHPYTWVNSGGLGTMGFAVPAAIGAKVGRPERMVWAVDGDGCFQMTAQELTTASIERIPVKVAILNNSYLGMVRQWQEMFYDERYSEVYLSQDVPDYVRWAEAMGCVGPAGRVPGGGAAGDRQGQRDRRPPGRHRLPHRQPREGLPDGRRRSHQRRHPGRAVPAGAGRGALMAAPAAGAGKKLHTLSVLVENKAGVLARVATPVRPPRLQHRVARRSRRATTSASAASRSSSTSRRPPSSRSPSSCSSSSTW